MFSLPFIQYNFNVRTMYFRVVFIIGWLILYNGSNFFTLSHC